MEVHIWRVLADAQRVTALLISLAIAVGSVGKKKKKEPKTVAACWHSCTADPEIKRAWERKETCSAGAFGSQSSAPTHFVTWDGL